MLYCQSSMSLKMAPCPLSVLTQEPTFITPPSFLAFSVWSSSLSWHCKEHWLVILWLVPRFVFSQCFFMVPLSFRDARCPFIRRLRVSEVSEVGLWNKELEQLACHSFLLVPLICCVVCTQSWPCHIERNYGVIDIIIPFYFFSLKLNPSITPTKLSVFVIIKSCYKIFSYYKISSHNYCIFFQFQ